MGLKYLASIFLKDHLYNYVDKVKCFITAARMTVGVSKINFADNRSTDSKVANLVLPV